MRLCVSAVLAIFLLSAQSILAQAAWTGFKQLGGTTLATSEASCSYVSAGKVACAVRDQNHKLAVNVYSAGVWSGWTALVDTVTSNPSCTDRAAGEVICAVRGDNNDLLFTVYNGSAWSALASAGGNIFSSPSCARVSATKILCAARSASGGLTSSTYSGTVWGSFINAAGTLTSGPSCASDSGGKVICAANSPNGHLLVNRSSGGAWEGFVDIGGSANSEPTCAKLGLTGQVLCVVRSSTAYYSIRFLGGPWVLGGWGSYTYTGLQGPSRASCGYQTAGQVVCATTYYYDGSLLTSVYTGTWAAAVSAGGVLFGPPTCTSFGSSKVLCAIVGLANKVTSTVGP